MLIIILKSIDETRTLTHLLAGYWKPTLKIKVFLLSETDDF